MSARLDIAIVGMAGCYPRARGIRQYWQNILDKVDAVAEAEPEWVGHYHQEAGDAQAQAEDRIYTTRGGFLRDLAQVDPMRYGVTPMVAAGSDPDHLLALHYAGEALADAGYLHRDFNRERAGVILGRGTYGNRALASTMSRNLFLDQAMAMVQGLRPDFSGADLARLKDAFKSQLPPFQAEHIGVLTPNVIAGLICNRFNLMGPSCIVDAACASSLIALEQAITQLRHGHCDLMITGGIHAHTPPQIFIQFCRINALARGQLRPFQEGADGTLLGEGLGLLVLKRRADAERDGDRIYALIQGIGSASDGRAKGLLAPRLEGEVLALRRAYESSGINPASLGFIEAHGTGTALGDATEVQALSEVFGDRGAGAHIGISAVKSMIGHCMPASGSAALIKSALALHHRVLPPMLCERPDPALKLEQTPFYILNEARPWIHGGPEPRRAGVNAFGFGGINSHLILEEYRPPRSVQAQVLHRPGGGELLLVAADSAAALRERIAMLRLHLAAPDAELAAIAQASAARAQGSHRLALVAVDSAEALRKLDSALEKLGDGSQPFKTRNGIHYGLGAAPGKLCFLFPGEGSQYPGMLAEACTQWPVLREWFDIIEAGAVERGAPSRAQALFPPPSVLSEAARQALEAQLYEGDSAAESVFAASLGLQSFYDDLGLVPQAMLGHSTGENTALSAWCDSHRHNRAQVVTAIREVNARYRALEAEGRIAQGTLLTVGALDAESRAALLADLGGMVVAMDNCPNQLVLFGSAEQAEAIRVRLSPQGAICAALPFGRAYHTPLFAPMAEAVRAYYPSLQWQPRAGISLYSACSVGEFPRTPEGIVALTAEQWQRPVRFTETLHRLYEDGYRVFLEVGPSANLTAFVEDTLRGRPGLLALASDSRRKSGCLQLQQTLAQLFAAGCAYDGAALFAQRALPEVDLAAPPPAQKNTGMQLKLLMPELKLPEEFRRPLPTTAATPDAQAELAPSQEDARDAALRMHFSLMQEFLDSQARVLGLAGVLPATAVPREQPAVPPAPSPMPMPMPAAVTADGSRYPLLGEIRLRERERLQAERLLDLASDVFLNDHAIGTAPTPRDPGLRPLPVLPFTFSMELIAEAAAALCEGEGLKLIGIDQARGSRWLALDSGRLRLRIQAERLPGRAGEPGGPQRIACRVHAPDEGNAPGGLLVFEGEVLLAAQYPSPPILAANSRPLQPPRLHTPEAIYRHGMFHGPRLQGCTRIAGWDAEGMDAELRALPVHDYFRDRPTPAFQFDAALLDAAGQLAGFWLREKYTEQVLNCFPYRVRSLRLYGPPPAAGQSLLCQGLIRLDGEAQQLEARWEIADREGQLRMRAEGWEDRVFAVPARLHAFRQNPAAAPLSEPLLRERLPPELCIRRLAPLEEGLLDEGGAIWKRVTAHQVLSAAERGRWYALPAQGPRREEWLMGRLSAKDAVRDWVRLRHGLELAPADIEIASLDSGRPVVRCAALQGRLPPAISLAHSRRWACAVASDPGVSLGLDYQRIEPLRTEDLIHGAFAASEQHWLSAPAGGPERARQAVALWCAKEAAAKAAGTGLQGRPQDWRVVAAQLDRRGGSPTVARVRQGERDYDVALHFEGDEAVLALCVATDAVPAVAVSD
ncbi:acyltransferase domain-containing protein [Stagnimonas aquatica]|uniref:Acyltransferase domain-containing protein n=1 Tax=Stagnimonas aquatica TaxID=2689987 RepID=A0A3N0V5H4_9GAMM|nr:type I polyketide synthase [Stagnimonas aquatica]ROH87811.1 acyltransferase domain-containing protein [Stagnimonas aquatica]